MNHWLAECLILLLLLFFLCFPHVDCPAGCCDRFTYIGFLPCSMSSPSLLARDEACTVRRSGDLRLIRKTKERERDLSTRSKGATRACPR